MAAKLRRGALFAACLSLLAGCSFGTFPDPNDPKDVAPAEQADVFHRNMQLAADELDRRVQTGEITDGQRLDMLAQLADKDLSEGDPDRCAAKDAWIYADLMITAHRYADAIPLLKRAIDWATEVKNDDRRVNDSFRLARCYAETGKVPDALDLAQKVIDSHPGDPGPVLPSVLLQITPSARGKGHDGQLAKVLEEAIHEHMRMIVNPNSQAGKAFLVARPFLIRRAWSTIEELYDQSGEHDKALAAEKREIEMLKSLEPKPSVQV